MLTPGNGERQGTEAKLFMLAGINLLTVRENVLSGEVSRRPCVRPLEPRLSTDT